MANVVGEKNIAGSVKNELADAFLESIPSGFKKKHAMTALAQIWLSIPEDERKAILVAQKEGITLEDIITNIVNRVLAQIHHQKATKAAKARPRKNLAGPSRSAKSA